MHSNIFQIGLNPMNVDDYVHPDEFYENSNDFADYIGDEYEGVDRLDCVEGLAECLNELFDYVGDGTLVYKGMGDFLHDWANEIKNQANAITEKNILKDLNIFRLSRIATETHKKMSSRFYIEDWSCSADPLSCLIEFLAQQKEGTKIYVGSVIDFHF